jgi:AcrR family transcriptional regulator
MNHRKTDPKPYHHGNLRESLMLAADELLAAQGLAALTLREVARVAGVSHAAPYHHFANLDELLAAVAARSFEMLGAALADAAGASDPREAMLRIGDAYVAHARAQPAHFRLMFGPLLSRKDEFPALALAARASFMQVLQAAERYAPGEGAVVALTGWSLGHGFAHLAIDGALEDLPLPMAPGEAMARRIHEWVLPVRDTPRKAGRAKSGA